MADSDIKSEIDKLENKIKEWEYIKNNPSPLDSPAYQKQTKEKAEGEIKKIEGEIKRLKELESNKPKMEANSTNRILQVTMTYKNMGVIKEDQVRKIKELLSDNKPGDARKILEEAYNKYREKKKTTEVQEPSEVRLSKEQMIELQKGIAERLSKGVKAGSGGLITEPVRFCKKCGLKGVPGAKFCKRCGRKIG